LAGMMGELEAKAANYRARLKEMEPPRGAPRS
jgi:hypothetical protein